MPLQRHSVLLIYRQFMRSCYTSVDFLSAWRKPYYVMLLSVVCASHGKPRLPNFLPTEKFAYRQLPQYIGFQQTSDVIACIDGQSIKYLPVVMYFCQLKHHIAHYVMHVSIVVEIIVKVNWKSFVTRHSKWFWYDFFLLCCIFRCGEPRSGAWCEADMSPVIEASWRVHWRHVTWPLVGVKVSL